MQYGDSKRRAPQYAQANLHKYNSNTCAADVVPNLKDSVMNVNET